MSVATVEPMADTSPFADMSPAIVAMLRDEANLSTARHVLDDARQDCLNRLETVQAQRPAFGFLAAKKQREDYQTQLASVQSQLAALEQMIARVNAARDRLQPSLRAALVEYLNQADAMYRQGFRASRFHERWRRAHALVADRLKAFLRDSRQLRNAIAGDLSRERARYSSDTVWHLTNTRTAAAELDREIDALNHVGVEHHSFVANTPFAEVKLPFIERWNCMHRIDAITLRSPAEGMVDTDKLLAEFSEMRQPVLDSIHGIFEASAAEHNQLAEARLRQCWSSLLAYAETHLVSDAELEPTLRDIESRQAEAERQRVLGQAVRPFEHER